MARRRAAGEAPPRTLVAAARRADLADPKLIAATIRKAAVWQEEAWALSHTVPEIGQTVRWSANLLSKLGLFVALSNPRDPSAEPTPARDGDGNVVAGVAVDLVEASERQLARLGSGWGGQPQLLRQASTHLDVPGEGYLVGWAARTATPKDPFGSPLGAPVLEPERWEMRSTSEVFAKDGRTYVGETQATAVALDPTAGDAIIRVWTPDGEFFDRADSPMRALIDDGKVLSILTAQMMAEGLSRRPAGVFLVPTEVEPVLAAEDANTPQDPEHPVDPVTVALVRAMGGAVLDPTSPESTVPIVLRAPADTLAQVRHITLSRTSDASLDARIEARVLRIARGLNAPVEVTEGHQQTTFANAEQIDQDAFEDHLEPKCVLLADLLTASFLRPNLVDEDGFTAADAATVCIWYNPSALIRQPDAEAAADEGLKNLSISWKAWRAAKGFTEADAPDAFEMFFRTAMNRGIFTAELTAAMLKAAAPADAPTVELPPPAPPGGPAAPAGDTAQVAAALLAGGADPEIANYLASLVTTGHARPSIPASSTVVHASARVPKGERVGQRMAAVDRGLRERLQASANRHMDRALEQGGTRLRNAARGETRQLLAGVSARDVPRTLGRPAAVTLLRAVRAAASEDDLLDGAWDVLERQFMDWGAAAQGTALELASSVVSNLTLAGRDALGLRQADDLAQAWEWMRGTLTSLAAARMFDPHPQAPPLGEFDPDLSVPAGVVRQAISRAGGVTGLRAADDGGAWVMMADGGTRPAGGIATGELVRDVLRDGGAMVEAYRWQYGAAYRARPFDPHLRLDGQVFANFDDPVLANSTGWPDSLCFPGDHSGCVCDFEPIIVPASDLG